MPSAIFSAKPLILGHRGVRGALVPENSLAAFEEAIRQGADGIELDARLCASGEVVVFHDKTLEQLSTGHGRVKEQPLHYLKALFLKEDGVDALGLRHSIPTLDEVLDALQPTLRRNPRFLLNVEIKGKDSPLPIADILARRLEAGLWKPHNLLVSHFKHERLPAFQERLPEVAVGLLFTQMYRTEKMLFKACTKAARQHQAVSIHLPVECFRQGILAERLQAEGLHVFGWTSGEKRSDAKENALLIKQQGISLITDYPKAIRQEITLRAP